jgi:hypothetical protein
MPCPKCGSKNTSLSLRQSNFWAPYPDGVEYSCYMCGLRLYGQKAIDKVEEWKAMSPTREQLLSQLREQEAQRLARTRLREELLRGELAGIRVQEAPEKVQAPVVKQAAPAKKQASPEKLERAKQRKREIAALRRRRIQEERAQEQLVLELSAASSAPIQEEDVVVQQAPIQEDVQQAPKEEDVQQAPELNAQKCSWVDCAEPRKSGSKYCSKKCSNKFAHARERERKLLAKKS